MDRFPKNFLTAGSVGSPRGSLEKEFLGRGAGRKGAVAGILLARSMSRLEGSCGSVSPISTEPTLSAKMNDDVTRKSCATEHLLERAGRAIPREARPLLNLYLYRLRARAGTPEASILVNKFYPPTRPVVAANHFFIVLSTRS